MLLHSIQLKQLKAGKAGILGTKSPEIDKSWDPFPCSIYRKHQMNLYKSHNSDKYQTQQKHVL